MLYNSPKHPNREQFWHALGFFAWLDHIFTFHIQIVIEILAGAITDFRTNFFIPSTDLETLRLP